VGPDSDGKIAQKISKIANNDTLLFNYDFFKSKEFTLGFQNLSPAWLVF
jgi:hypothetical protein